MDKIAMSFLVKRNKKRNDGLCPLYFRIRVGGETTEVFLQHNIKEEDWDSIRQRVKAKSSQSVLINSTIQQKLNAAQQITADLRLANQPITASIIKMKLLGDESGTSLLDLFSKHNHDVELRIGNDYRIATLSKYKLTREKVVQFIQQKYQRNDIKLQELKHDFVADFETFLKAQQKLHHNTAMKHIKNLKKIVRIGIRMGVLQSHPFEDFKCSIKAVMKDFLTQQEIDAIASKSTLNERLEVVRDVFLFSCYPGLAYSDVAAISQHHIQHIETDLRTILISRLKNGMLCRIPILTPAEKIINKYKIFADSNSQKKLFPVKSNQKTNEYLKEIAGICGITKRLTFHMARHTFATTIALCNGISMEVVSTVLGHGKITTTQIYAKMTDERLVREMRNLNNSLQTKTINHE